MSGASNASPDPPQPSAAPTDTTPTRRRGNPNLAPRCGAKARTTGCPCRAPAMANGRCRMHGGKSTGARTAAGVARMTAANTTHGKYAAAGAPDRALQRYVSTVIVRNRLVCDAMRLSPYLPPDMAARLDAGPRELFSPAHPSNLPFVPARAATLYTLQLPPPAKPRHPRTAQPDAAPLAPRARDSERHAARQESAAHAPWQAAIAAARAAKRATLAANRATRAVKRAAAAAKQAARCAALPQSPATRSDPMHPSPAPDRPTIHSLATHSPARAVGAPSRPAAPPHPASPASPPPDRARHAATPCTLSPPPQPPITRAPTPPPAPTAHRPTVTAPITPALTHRTPTTALALRTTTLAKLWELEATRATLAARFAPAEHPARPTP
jgi:hypothetical protein